MPITVDASASEIERSKVQRYGNRYYPVDESYDKRVYENTFGNWLIIILVLICFWIFQSCHWWGVFELGTNYTEILMWYSIGIFVFTILVGACMLTSGKYANRKKRLHEFLIDKISEKKSKAVEEEMRKKQEEEYAARIAAAAAIKDDSFNPGIQDEGNELLAAGTRM